MRGRRRKKCFLLLSIQKSGKLWDEKKVDQKRSVVRTRHCAAKYSSMKDRRATVVRGVVWWWWTLIYCLPDQSHYTWLSKGGDLIHAKKNRIFCQRNARAALPLWCLVNFATIPERSMFVKTLFGAYRLVQSSTSGYTSSHSSTFAFYYYYLYSSWDQMKISLQKRKFSDSQGPPLLSKRTNLATWFSDSN